MLIIGIAGGTGSGKTTVVKKIIEKFPKNEVAILSQDSYYKDNSHLNQNEKKKINFDHPNSLEFDLLVKDVKKLKNGKSINQPIYSYLTCERSKKTIIVKAKNVIIVEGILILTNKELRKLLDIKVFVHTEADKRLIRVIRRDTIERGRSVDETLRRYEKFVRPMHLQFIEPSKTYADIIVPQGGKNKVAIEILSTIIQKWLL